MRLIRLLKIIKKYHWWEESGPGVYQCVMYPLHAFIEESRYFHPKYLTVSIFIIQNEFFYEETPEEEKYEIYKYIFKQAKRDRRYLVKKRQACDKNKKFIQVGKLFEKNKDKLNNRQFWYSYQDFIIKYYLNYLRYAAALESVDIFTAYHLESLVRNELAGQTEETIRAITRNTSMPNHLSFMEQERLLILELCLKEYSILRRSKKISLNDIKDKNWIKKLSKLSKNYFWTRNNFAYTTYLTRSDYFKEIRNEARKKSVAELKSELASLKTKVGRVTNEQSKILKKYKLSADLKLHFYLVRYMGEWIDDRKKHMLMANHYINLYCQELAKRFKLDIRKVKYYLPEDFKNLLLKNNKLNPEIANARRKFSAYVIEKHGHQARPTVFYGKTAKKLFAALMSRLEFNCDVIKGQVASAPVNKISGTIRVVKDIHKQKFTAGNILVTTMTRPEFMPYVRRAKAIITDEGGLTCHAAIVSRELKIPCIIGTKVATRVLKSGNRVEMDLEKGIVKKL